MHVSGQVAQWIEAALAAHAQSGEDVWWDTTMIPSRGAGEPPALALTFAVRAPLLGHTLATSTLHQDFVDFTPEVVSELVQALLRQMREAFSRQLQEAAPPNHVGPGSVFLPPHLRGEQS